MLPFVRPHKGKTNTALERQYIHGMGQEEPGPYTYAGWARTSTSKKSLGISQWQKTNRHILGGRKARVGSNGNN